MDSSDILVSVISGVLILLGAVGSVLPILPGPPLSFGALWFFAWATDYERIGAGALWVFGILTLLTLVVDFFAPALGAKGYKASRYGIIGSFIGAFGGLFVFGPIGIILGPFIGGFIGEVVHARNYDQAMRVAWGSFIGFLIGSVFKISVILGMFVYFIYSLF